MRRLAGYFITGTDTNVGKTYVTCALARRARDRGHHVFAFKPVETGCASDATGQLIGSDQEMLATAAGNWQRGDLRGAYRFPLPAAPYVAAAAAHASIDLASLVRLAHSGPEHGATFTLVEGAGGWRVPITKDGDMSTLARELGLPVIIVARAGLGTINHTLLTIEAVQRDALPVTAVVLSERPDDDPMFTQSNRTEILRRWSGSVCVLGSDLSALDSLLPAS